MTTTASPIARPWYKEPWPWFIIGMLMTAVVGASTCVYISFKHADAVVSDEWYQDGKNVNQSIDMEKHAMAIGLVATVMADPSANTFTVQLKANRPLRAAPVSATLQHVSDPTLDETLTLSPLANGSYQGSLTKPLHGRYYITLQTADWKLQDAEVFPQGQFIIEASTNTSTNKPISD